MFLVVNNIAWVNNIDLFNAMHLQNNSSGLPELWKISGNLYRNGFCLALHFVFALEIGDFRLPGAGFFVRHGDETGDNQNIADVGAVCRRAVNGDNSRPALCGDGVGGETITVGHVPDMNSLVFKDAGRIEEILINSAGAFIVQVGLRARPPSGSPLAYWFPSGRTAYRHRGSEYHRRGSLFRSAPERQSR